MSKYLHSVVEFYLDGDSVPKSGYVIEESDISIRVTIEHGPMHGEVFDVEFDNIIDDTFDKYALDDEKLYAWYDGE